MSWSESQQRAHNLSTFDRMPRVWFPEPRKTYTFSPALIELANRVFEAQKEVK